MFKNNFIKVKFTQKHLLPVQRYFVSKLKSHYSSHSQWYKHSLTQNLTAQLNNLNVTYSFCRIISDQPLANLGAYERKCFGNIN